MSTAIRNVLVVNAGSSSLKFMLFDMESEKMLAKGQVERIGIGNSLFTFSTEGFSEKQSPCEAPDHTAAVRLACGALTDPAKGGRHRRGGPPHCARRREVFPAGEAG